MNIRFLLLILALFAPSAVSARCCFRAPSSNCCAPISCCPSTCGTCCNNPPFCGPYPRPLPGQYASYKDNTRMIFWNMPPCAPRNDSKERGYLLKGSWWDNTGVRYWAFRNGTNNTITIDGLEGGQTKDIPAGDVANIERGESYAFRVQAPAHRFELFASEEHNIEIFINVHGDIDYRVEIPTDKMAKRGRNRDNEVINPKF